MGNAFNTEGITIFAKASPKHSSRLPVLFYQIQYNCIDFGWMLHCYYPSSMQGLFEKKTVDDNKKVNLKHQRFVTNKITFIASAEETQDSYYGERRIESLLVCINNLKEKLT